MGYPSPEEETEILDRRTKRETDEVRIEEIVRKEEIIEMQKMVERVHIEKELERYIVETVAATRGHTGVELGASPRASLAMLKLSKANAWLHKRDFVLPDDIKAVAVPALSHRVILTADQWIKGAKSESIIKEVLSRIAVPKVD